MFGPRTPTPPIEADAAAMDGFSMFPVETSTPPDCAPPPTPAPPPPPPPPAPPRTGDFGRKASTSVRTPERHEIACVRVKTSEHVVRTDYRERTGRHWHDGAAVLQPGAHSSLPLILVPSFRAIDGELLPEHVRPAIELLG